MTGDPAPGRTIVRAWVGERVVAVLDVVPDRDLGILAVSATTSVVDPRHLVEAEAALCRAASAGGLRPGTSHHGALARPSAWRIVYGTIVAWAERTRRGVTVHARELVPEGPVPTMRTGFHERVDDDGDTWMAVDAVGIETAFPRRGAARAAYDLVEELTGIETRPNGWKGIGGILCGEEVYTFWRRRLAAKGIDADAHLWRMLVRNLRHGIRVDRLAALDAQVAADMALHRADFPVCPSP